MIKKYSIFEAYEALIKCIPDKPSMDKEVDLIDKDLMVPEDEYNNIEISKYLVRKYFDKVGEDNV